MTDRVRQAEADVLRARRDLSEDIAAVRGLLWGITPLMRFMGRTIFKSTYEKENAMREGRMRGTGRTTASRVKRSASKAAEAARETAEEYADEAQGRARAAYDHASEWASDAYQRGSRGYQRARKASEDAFHTASDNMHAMVNERPYVVGLAGLAAGILIGALVTRSCSSAYHDDWDEEEE